MADKKASEEEPVVSVEELAKQATAAEAMAKELKEAVIKRSLEVDRPAGLYNLKKACWIGDRLLDPANNPHKFAEGKAPRSAELVPEPELEPDPEDAGTSSSGAKAKK